MKMVPTVSSLTLRNSPVCTMQPGTAGRRWYATSCRSSQKMHWTCKTALGMYVLRQFLRFVLAVHASSHSPLPAGWHTTFVTFLPQTDLHPTLPGSLTPTLPSPQLPILPHNNLSHPPLLSLLTPRQQTALHKAAWYGYRTISVLLIEAGASLLIKDYQCYTPYQRSMQSGDEDLMKYLQGEG